MNKIITLLLLLTNVMLAQASPQGGVHDYTIVQDGIEAIVPVYNGVIKLEREPFSIQFYNRKYDWDAKKPYTTQVSVLKNKAKWKKIESGGKVEKSQFFDGGSSFAITPEHRYNALFFSDMDTDYIGGSHNIRFGNKEENRTADLINKTDDYFKLEFKVDNLFLVKTFVKIEDSKLSNLYFAIFSDKNLDGIIDEDELTKFTLRFK